MDKEAIKELMYGGIEALTTNKEYYYNSGIGVGYSRWTEAGQQAVMEFTQLMAFKILQAKDAELDKRAKELVINGLKGEKV